MKLPLPITDPVVSLDIESTGTDAVLDRIIQFGAVRLDPPDLLMPEPVLTRKEWLINPGRPIPPESTKIHGITDYMVHACPRFESVAAEIHKFISGADIIGYSLFSLDLPMLSEEFERCHIEFDVTQRKIIDAAAIFKKKEPRDLTSALKKYCGRDHVGAHGALADAEATLDVLVGQCAHYEDLNRMGVAALSEFSTALEHDGAPAKRLDLAGTLIQDANGVARYTLRKVRGVAVEDDPGFGEWMLRNSFASDTKRVLRKLLAAN